MRLRVLQVVGVGGSVLFDADEDSAEAAGAVIAVAEAEYLDRLIELTAGELLGEAAVS